MTTDTIARGLAVGAKAQAKTVAGQSTFGVFPTLSHFYKKLLNGASYAGTVLSIGTNVVRIVTFGDSVGTSKTKHVIARLQQAQQNAGVIFNSKTLAGGASVHSDVSDCTYWINGQWDIIPAAGSITYLASGGKAYATQLKIYYATGPSEGTFKVQTDSGSGYADEASYTNVNANAGSIGAGVITLTKTAGSFWGVKLVGLTGTIHPLLVVPTYESASGVAWYDFTQGGLELATSVSGGVATPVAIVNAVLADIAPDLCMMEYKDDGAFPAAFASFMANYKANVSATSDWVFVGTSPRADPVTQALEVTNNGVMQTYAAANGHFYFDGFSLLSYAQMLALGWNGDGTHPAEAYNVFMAGLLWSQLGFDNAWVLNDSKDVSTVQGRVKDTLTFGSTSGREIGDIGKDSSETDLVVKAVRGVSFRRRSNSTIYAWLDTSGNHWGFQCEVVGLTAGGPSTTGPAIRGLASAQNSGGFSSDISPGNAPFAWTPWGASKLILGTSSGQGPTWTQGTGSPETVVTAPIGSHYSRTDGGAGTSLYVKESGVGNTGWVGK